MFPIQNEEASAGKPNGRQTEKLFSDVAAIDFILTNRSVLLRSNIRVRITLSIKTKKNDEFTKNSILNMENSHFSSHRLHFDDRLSKVGKSY